MIIVPIFVDDIFPACHTLDLAEMTADMDILRAKYSIPPMEDADVILGMRVTRSRENRTLALDQSLYITRLLDSFRMQASSPAPAPESKHTDRKFAPDDPRAPPPSPPLSPHEILLYGKCVGSLMYASLSTRPDIAHAVAILSRTLQAPTQDNWVRCKHVLRYLNGCHDRPLILGNKIAGVTESTIVLGPNYCDADWAGDTKTRRSTSGYVLQVHGSAVCWASKQQACVALSSAESEYYAIGLAVQELLWLRHLMQELGFTQLRATVLHTDNQPAMAIASDDCKHPRSKHVDAKHHFIREHIGQNTIALRYVSTLKNAADIFTKALVSTVLNPLLIPIMGPNPFADRRQHGAISSLPI